MGDRCWVQVTVRKEQEKQFCEVVGYDCDERSEDECTVTMNFPDANYGMGPPLDHAAVAGIEFYGSHTSGDSYGAADFFYSANRDSEVVYIPTGHHGRGIVVTGSSPGDRWRRLRALEEHLVNQHDLIQRMHNPLYDLVRTADAAAS